MIFVTVGTQLPFDRLVRAIDNIAPELAVPVFAQVGKSTYEPRNIEWSAVVDAANFNSLMAKVTTVVAHAGIGTIISAQESGKPLVLMPRQASKGEHRNDHQMATVQSLCGRRGIYVAHDERELLDLLLKSDLAPPATNEMAVERAGLISAVNTRLLSSVTKPNQ